MTRISDVLKGYRESGPMHALVPVNAAIDNDTFLTKRGDLMQILKIEGVDYECLDAADVAHIAQRFDAAMRGIGEEFRVYQYFIKREHPPLRPSAYANPVVQAATDDRLHHLANKTLYSLDLFMVISYEGWRQSFGAPQPRNDPAAASILAKGIDAARDLFSVGRQVTRLDNGLSRARDVLANRVNSFVVQLKETVRVKLLDKQEGFRFLRSLINFTPHKSAVNLQHDTLIDFQACGSSVECHQDHLLLDNDYVQVLTLKDLPTQTWANMFHGLYEIDCPFILVTEWQRESNGRMRRLIDSQRRHHFNSKRGLTSYFGSSTAPTDGLIDDSALAHIADLGGCLRELEVDGNHFGVFSYTVVLHNSNPSCVKRAVAECFKVFSACGAQVIEERYNLLNAFAAILPGNHAFNLRRQWLLNTNYADWALLFTQRSGDAQNAHLRAEYLAVLETNHGTPYFLNLHYQDVAHAIVIGATGSGKSFFLDFLLTHAQKYNPYTFIFDLGGSYGSLTELFGGTYVSMGAPGGRVKINPFCLPPTPENLQFLLIFVRVLIESSSYVITGPDEVDLYEQIQNMYEIDPDHRRLSTLAGILRQPLRQALAKWIEGGPYGTYFDNVEDNLTFSRFQTFDFEGMDKVQALEPLLFYVLHRANAVICGEELATTFKVFVMDEAWRFLRHPTIKNYILEALKTWRKKNAAMILATQSGDDLLESQMLSAVVENCATKIFLANPGMNKLAYRDVFHLNETEADLIADLIPKQQMLVKRPDLAKVVNLTVDPKGYWLYTSDPYDREKKKGVFERYGFEKGIEILAGGKLI